MSARLTRWTSWNQLDSASRRRRDSSFGVTSAERSTKRTTTRVCSRPALHWRTQCQLWMKLTSPTLSPGHMRSHTVAEVAAARQKWMPSRLIEIQPLCNRWAWKTSWIQLMRAALRFKRIQWRRHRRRLLRTRTLIWKDFEGKIYYWFWHLVN